MPNAHSYGEHCLRQAAVHWRHGRWQSLTSDSSARHDHPRTVHPRWNSRVPIHRHRTSGTTLWPINLHSTRLVPFKVALRDHSLASSRQRRHLGENQGHSEYAHARRQCPHPVVSILTTRLEDRDMVSDLAFANFIFCCPVPFITQQRVASVFVRLKTTTQMGFPVSFG